MRRSRRGMADDDRHGPGAKASRYDRLSGSRAETVDHPKSTVSDMRRGQPQPKGTQGNPQRRSPRKVSAAKRAAQKGRGGHWDRTRASAVSPEMPMQRWSSWPRAPAWRGGLSEGTRDSSRVAAGPLSPCLWCVVHAAYLRIAMRVSERMICLSSVSLLLS